MKKFITNYYRVMCLFISSLMLSMLCLAQDKKVDVDINTKSDSGGFFTNPIVWIVGGAVFLLLLVALLRNNSNK